MHWTFGYTTPEVDVAADESWRFAGEVGPLMPHTPWAEDAEPGTELLYLIPRGSPIHITLARSMGRDEGAPSALRTGVWTCSGPTWMSSTTSRRASCR